LGAWSDYTRVMEQEPDHEIAYHRAWAAFELKAWAWAEHDFEEALWFDPASLDALVGRGLARVMRCKYREAVADGELALSRQPTSHESLFNLACLFAQACDRVQQDKKAPDRLALAGRYRATAVQALRGTLDLLLPEARPAFWRDRILEDSALE